MLDEQQQPMPQPDMQAPTADGKVMARETPDVDKGRLELVKDWIKKVEEGKAHWKDVFQQMRDDARFTSGKQWPDQAKDDDRYRANITLRHINQRVASIYAKNPRVRAIRKPKVWLEHWDGTPEMLQMAQQSIAAVTTPPEQLAAEAMMTGQPPQPPAMDPVAAGMVVQEAQEVTQQKRLYDRMGKTLEIVAQYSLDEPIPKFKAQAKQLVRRVLTCKVGYLKLGYQRIMEQSPDIDAKIKDATDRLAHLEMLAADLADEQIEEHGKQAEELKLNLAALQQQREIVLREGLVFGFPKAWAIIPDPNVVQLKGFIGAEWVAEEHIFTPDQVKKIYKIDVGKDFTRHTVEGAVGDKRKKDDNYCAVYEIHDLVGQVGFTVCAGYPDFLKAPGEPDVDLEQFHPYFVLSFNDTEDPDSPYPPSDVELMRPMQLEYNRSREGLRQHRRANTPALVSAQGALSDETKAKLSSHIPFELVETNLSKNDDINKVLMAKPTVPIQAELYDTEFTFVDVQRVVQDQAANLGGTSGATATESSIAENSRTTSLQSCIDDLDEFLTDVMRASGQVLFAEMGKEQVVRIAGPAAVWPEVPQSRKDIAEELMLEVKAGSSGRPNRAARLTALEKTAPLLLQIPGIKPQKMADMMFVEIDEGIDLEDFYQEGLPSITAMNSMAKPNLAAGPGNEAQGPAGAMNAQQPGQSAGKAQGMYPAPDPRGPEALTT